MPIEFWILITVLAVVGVAAFGMLGTFAKRTRGRSAAGGEMPGWDGDGGPDAGLDDDVSQ